MCGHLSHYYSRFVVQIVLCDCQPPAHSQIGAPARGQTPTLATAFYFGQIARRSVLTCLSVSLIFGSADTYSYSPLCFEGKLLGIRGWPARLRWWSRHKAGVASRVWVTFDQNCVWFVWQDICKSLWCHRTGHRCETKFMPAAEGTTCGPDMVRKHTLHSSKFILFYFIVLDSVHWCVCPLW